MCGGKGEWFELNAAEQLLLYLAEAARGDEPYTLAIVLNIAGQTEGKDELSVDRNY